MKSRAQIESRLAEYDRQRQNIIAHRTQAAGPRLPEIMNHRQREREKQRLLELMRELQWVLS